MKKRLGLICLLILAIVGLVGCDKKKVGYYDPKIEVEGVTLTFPMQYNQLKELGFSVSEEAENAVLRIDDSDQHSEAVYDNNGKVIGELNIINTSGEPALLKDCFVYGMRVGKVGWNEESTADVEFSYMDKINMTLSQDELIKILGEPTRQDENEIYWFAADESIEAPGYYNMLVFYYEDGKMIATRLTYLGNSYSVPEYLQAVADEDEYEVIPYINWNETKITFPLMYEDLKALGIQADPTDEERLSEEYEEMFACYDSDGNKVGDVYAGNVDYEETALKNYKVYGMAIEANDSFSFRNGFTFASTLDDLKKLMGDPVFHCTIEKDGKTLDEYRWYSQKASHMHLHAEDSLYVHFDGDTMTDIIIRYQGWDY